jgi:hypothetical protein
MIVTPREKSAVQILTTGVHESSLFEQDEVFLSEGLQTQHNLNEKLKLPVIKTYIAFCIQILFGRKVQA